MSRGINKTISIGNLTADPETRQLPSGDAVTNIRLAMSDSYKKDGELVDATEFVNVVFFKRQAEVAAQYLKKGSKIYVEGQLKTRQWEKDGQKRYSTEIVAREMQMLDSKGGTQSSTGSPTPQQSQPENFEEDIPF